MQNFAKNSLQAKKVVDAFKRHVPIRFKEENQVILTRVNLKSYTYTTLRLIRAVSIKKLKSVFRIEKQVIVFKTNLRIKYPAKSETRLTNRNV